MPTALDGLRVVDLSRVISGPYGTQFLADLGADVIKVENPAGGDDFRLVPPYIGDSKVAAYFTYFNRNKRSIALDFTKADGKAVLLDLIGKADILVENFTPQVTRKYGLDFESLAAKFPRLIYLSISAYGQSGPLSKLGGLDPVVSTFTGLTALTGSPGEPPIGTSLPWLDITTALYAQIGVLAALHARDRLGQAQYVDVSMYDSAIADLTYQAASFLATGKAPGRWGRIRAMATPSGLYEASDGKQIYVYPFTEGHFLTLCKLVGRLDIAEHPNFAERIVRVQHAEELTEIFTGIVLQDTSKNWIARLQAAGIPCAELREPSEALMSAESLERDLVTEIPHPVLGTIFNVASPIRMKMTPPVDPVASPSLGQHTDEILKSVLQYQDDRISSLRQTGIIK